MEMKCWLWPDHAIGKRESRDLREEHNALVNHAFKLEEALNGVMGWYGMGNVSLLMSELGETASYHRTVNAARAALRDCPPTPAPVPAPRPIITVTVEGGVVSDVTSDSPAGVTVLVRDYDVDSEDGPGIETDTDGNRYLCCEYEL